MISAMTRIVNFPFLDGDVHVPRRTTYYNIIGMLEYEVMCLEIKLFYAGSSQYRYHKLPKASPTLRTVSKFDRH